MNNINKRYTWICLVLKRCPYFGKRKKDFGEDSFSEELQGIAVKDYSSNITKTSVNKAIDWLYSSGIIRFAGKLPECNFLDFKAKASCYLMDVGLAYYFLTKTGVFKAAVSGTINENFVYLDLKHRIAHPSESHWKRRLLQFLIMVKLIFGTYGEKPTILLQFLFMGFPNLRFKAIWYNYSIIYKKRFWYFNQHTVLFGGKHKTVRELKWCFGCFFTGLVYNKA